MAYDGIYAAAIAQDLKETICGSKIEKITQPENETVVMQLNTPNGRKKLLLCASPQGARVHLTEQNFENPEVAPNFCMFLRKYISGGRIRDVIQKGYERIIEFTIETTTEMGDVADKRLICETMGKHSNIILVDAGTGRIMDGIKRISIDINRYRQILPGATYIAPPASDNPDYFEKVKSNFESEEICPTIYFENGVPREIHIHRLISCSEMEQKKFENIHLALDYFYANRLQTSKLMQMQDGLQKTVSGIIDKQLLKKQRLLEDIKKADEADIYRVKGEILNANLHAVKPGTKSVELINYYDNKPIKIELDERFSPAKNAQNYFKKYNKLKNGGKEKTILLGECNSDIEYLQQVQGQVPITTSCEEVELLRKELAEQGFLRLRQAAKKVRAQKPKPRRFTLPCGREIIVGRSNTENDYISFKVGGKQDYWFHAKDMPGSHVVLLMNGEEPTADEVYQAAGVAAWYSKGKASENVPVDYLPLRYLKKPAGAKPGMVIFTNNKTVWINPLNPEK